MFTFYVAVFQRVSHGVVRVCCVVCFLCWPCLLCLLCWFLVNAVSRVGCVIALFLVVTVCFLMIAVFLT